MNIELYKQCWKFFNEIKVGDVFVYYKVAYMKISDVYFERSKTKFNAVNLFTGGCVLIHQGSEVEKLGRLREVPSKEIAICRAGDEE